MAKNKDIIPLHKNIPEEHVDIFPESVNLEELVMDEESLKGYIFPRKFHSDPSVQKDQIENLKKVIIHNGYLPDEVRAQLKKTGADFLEYTPEKTSKSHFYDGDRKILHVTNPRGIIRLQRDIDLVTLLTPLLGRTVPYRVYHWGDDNKVGDEFSANERARDFAKNRALNAFLYLKENKFNLQGKINIVFGPHESLDTSQADRVVCESKHDYLNYKILEMSDNIAVCYDYVYADQARMILHQVFNVCSSYFKGHNVNVFHYGKVGSLKSFLKKYMVFVPNSSCEYDSFDFRNEPNGTREEIKKNELQNCLSSANLASAIFRQEMGEFMEGTTLNATSTIRQKKIVLERARNNNTLAIDMEFRSLAAVGLPAKTIYKDIRSTKNFFAGVISDAPSEGENLGNTHYDRTMERKMATAYLKIIRTEVCETCHLM